MGADTRLRQLLNLPFHVHGRSVRTRLDLRTTAQCLVIWRPRPQKPGSGGGRLADLPCLEVSLTVAAPPERVWALVSDVTRVGDWGGECVGAEGVEGPAVGARFSVTRSGRTGSGRLSRWLLSRSLA
ncbi:MAG: SRPBCC family protein [Pseudonocardiaceae bacterium]